MVTTRSGADVILPDVMRGMMIFLRSVASASSNMRAARAGVTVWILLRFDVSVQELAVLADNG